MALCDGERNPSGLQCNGTVYKCSACGSTGCKQNKPELCSKQGFSVLGKCSHCGALGTLEVVPSADRAPRKTPAYVSPNAAS